MRRLLDLLAGPSTRAPRATLLLLVAVTLVFGGLATGLQVSTSLDDFAPEGGLGQTLNGLDDRFSAGTSLQLIVDTGPGGNLLTSDGLAAGARLQDALADDAELAPLLAEEAVDRPAVLTYAEPFVQAATATGAPLDELDAATTDALVAASLSDDQGGAQATALLSGDLERDPPRARGGLGIVEVAAGASSDELGAASDAVERVAAEVGESGIRVAVLSDTVIQRAIDEGITRDIPVLLSISLALVVLVLAGLFRTVSDVAVGLAGLLASIVWMVGLAALLGPGMLDLVGPFGQTAIAVPVLLVGLGVDYSVHLTTRYREQQRAGDHPADAATTALHTVGIALVLATAATVGGFLANLATPLPPIADLGVFAALGIVSAFVIFGLAVPAARVLLDRRRPAGDVPIAAGTGGSGRSGWTDALTRVTVGHPVAVLAVTGLLLSAGGISAAGLGTEFNQRDFLPDGAPVTATIDRADELFGGDVGEETFVVVDGDPSDPELLAATRQLQNRLGTLDEVRRIGDRAQITSPFELVDRLGDRGLRARSRLAADLEGWADPDAATAARSVPDRVAPATIEASAEDGAPVDVPQDLREALASRLPDGRSPATALATTGDPDRIQAAVRDELRDQVLADRPEEVTDATVAQLAAVPIDELTTDRLASAGYPLDALSDPDRAALNVLERLVAAGWRPDEASTTAADVADRLTVAEDVAGDELAATVADDGVLLVASTSAGQDGADALAARITELGDVVAAAGGEVTVVSQPLVTSEIIDELSAAQLLAIVISIAIAGALLVAASVVSDRSVGLGLIGVAPAITALVLVLGSMRVLGLSFNALTATVASIAVGIGVPYGIHLTNRFRASLRTQPNVTAAVGDTLRHTGGALAGSAVTTGLAFGVLGLSSSVPLRQFGLVSALMIVYALLACLLLQPTLLALWARRRGQ